MHAEPDIPSQVTACNMQATVVVGPGGKMSTVPEAAAWFSSLPLAVPNQRQRLRIWGILLGL